MNISEIKEIIQAAVDSGISELEVQRGDNRVRVVRGAVQQEVVYAAAAPAAPVVAAPVVQPVATAPAAPAEDSNTTAVKSPIVGTFYSSPSPGAPAFVNVGDHVKPGQVLCIIESMKLMNEIESEVAGTIVARHVESGQPVEYGASLFSVRPN